MELQWLKRFNMTPDCCDCYQRKWMFYHLCDWCSSDNQNRYGIRWTTLKLSCSLWRLDTPTDFIAILMGETIYVPTSQLVYTRPLWILDSDLYQPLSMIPSPPPFPPTHSLPPTQPWLDCHPQLYNVYSAFWILCTQPVNNYNRKVIKYIHVSLVILEMNHTSYQWNHPSRSHTGQLQVEG